MNTDSKYDLLRESVTGEKKINNLKSDVSGFINLQNKINYLREVFLKRPIDIVCIDETKIYPSFPDSQFHIDEYQFPPFRRD